jgi:hypothetical protein
VNGEKCPRLQILTVEELFEGKRPLLPPNGGTHAYAVAPMAKAKKAKQGNLFPE